MPDLLEWSHDLPGWARDALRRIALGETLSEADIEAVGQRLMHAHGIAVDGDTTCVPLVEDHLPIAAGVPAPTILCGIGPVRHVDRLVGGQELRFALGGITLVYGDNGSGKSGYARIAKKLCRARVVDDLRGDVFADQREPPAEVRVRYRLPGDEQAQTEDWRDGMPGPTALARMSVLDPASARVYIDGSNEIIFLPREIAIITRLGDLYTKLGTSIQAEVEGLVRRCAGSYGAGYGETTSAGRLVLRLVTGTLAGALPAANEIQRAGVWDDQKAQELHDLNEALAHDPRAKATARRRSSNLLTALAGTLETVGRAVDDDATTALRGSVREAAVTAEAVALSAGERFAGELVTGTGSEGWRRMFALARAFAADAGQRRAEEPFRAGDPCPLCQTPLDLVATERIRRFDDFVRGRAATEAEAARTVAADSVRELTDGQFPSAAEIDRMMAEYRGLGEAEDRIASSAAGYAVAASARRDALLVEAGTGVIGNLAALPEQPAARLHTEAARLTAEAEALDAEPARDPQRSARAAELIDTRRLSQELDAVLRRLSDLERWHQLSNCKVALDTEPVSRFATRRRQDLVTPDLRRRIEKEFVRLDLAHIPLRIAEASNRGHSFFDVELDTRQQAQKSRILSEGEQRVLGIACFLAEIGRVPGTHGIIVDDPVSSLDHLRLRKVAERLVKEAGTGRQVIIFTHNLVFYQEVRSAAAAHNPPVPCLTNLIGRAEGGRFGLITNDDEPWIAKKVTLRIEAIRAKLAAISENDNRDTEQYRETVKTFYTDLRETWERLVEEVLLGGVVERYSAGVKTQSLKGVTVEDEDYRVIFAAMTRTSERSGHDMAAGRQIAAPDKAEMRRDLDEIEQYRGRIHTRRGRLEEARRQLEKPPKAVVG